MLHGFLGSMMQWKQHIRSFTDRGFDCILIDLLGFGNSPKPYQSCALEDHLITVKNTITHCSRYRQIKKLYGIGYSFGGLLIISLASRYVHFDKIVVIAPPIHTTNHSAKHRVRDARITSIVVLWKFLHLLIMRIVRIVRYLEYHTMGKNPSDRLYRRLLGTECSDTILNFINHDPVIASSVLKDIILDPENTTILSLEHLNKMGKKILWIHGYEDHYCNYKEMMDVAQKFPNLFNVMIFRDMDHGTIINNMSQETIDHITIHFESTG